MIRSFVSPLMSMNLRQYFEPAFDLRRLERNYAEYDQRRGYRAYHAHCRAGLRANVNADVGADAPTALEQRGFQVLDGLLLPATATRLLGDATAAGEFSLLKKNARDLHGYRLRDPAAVARLLGTVLIPRVDALARRFFGCEYQIGRASCRERV